jgi:hypothetical protein
MLEVTPNLFHHLRNPDPEIEDPRPEINSGWHYLIQGMVQGDIHLNFAV